MYFPLLGFKGNLPLLGICVIFPGGLSKWKFQPHRAVAHFQPQLTWQRLFSEVVSPLGLVCRGTNRKPPILVPKFDDTCPFGKYMALQRCSNTKPDKSHSGSWILFVCLFGAIVVLQTTSSQVTLTCWFGFLAVLV